MFCCFVYLEGVSKFVMGPAWDVHVKKVKDIGRKKVNQRHITGI